MSSKQSSKPEAERRYTVATEGAFAIGNAVLRKGDTVSLRPSVADRYGALLKLETSGAAESKKA